MDARRRTARGLVVWVAFAGVVLLAIYGASSLPDGSKDWEYVFGEWVWVDPRTGCYVHPEQPGQTCRTDNR